MTAKRSLSAHRKRKWKAAAKKKSVVKCAFCGGPNFCHNTNASTGQVFFGLDRCFCLRRCFAAHPSVFLISADAKDLADADYVGIFNAVEGLDLAQGDLCAQSDIREVVTGNDTVVDRAALGPEAAVCTAAETLSVSRSSRALVSSDIALFSFSCVWAYGFRICRITARCAFFGKISNSRSSGLQLILYTHFG